MVNPHFMYISTSTSFLSILPLIQSPYALPWCTNPITVDVQKSITPVRSRFACAYPLPIGNRMPRMLLHSCLLSPWYRLKPNDALSKSCEHLSHLYGSSIRLFLLAVHKQRCHLSSTAPFFLSTVTFSSCDSETVRPPSAVFPISSFMACPHLFSTMLLHPIIESICPPKCPMLQLWNTFPPISFFSILYDFFFGNLRLPFCRFDSPQHPHPSVIILFRFSSSSTSCSSPSTVSHIYVPLFPFEIWQGISSPFTVVSSPWRMAVSTKFCIASTLTSSSSSYHRHTSLQQIVESLQYIGLVFLPPLL